MVGAIPYAAMARYTGAFHQCCDSGTGIIRTSLIHMYVPHLLSYLIAGRDWKTDATKHNAIHVFGICDHVAGT